jgi:hypothetical protein
MNKHKIICRARIVAALLAGIFLIPALRAQPAQDSGNRFLLVFETSSDMKKRAPSVEKALDQILALGMGGELSRGDTIGVWTFNEVAHAGEFPLQNWDAEDAANIAGNIAAFVKRQRYAKEGRFDVVLPLLNRIAKNSERLTVLIFCDGEDEIHGTPFDVGINQVFKQRQRERQKSKQPLVITLCSQLGSFVGCTVSFPPAQVNLPEFPPWPEPTNTPPPVTNAIANVPLPKPEPPQAPPLIIIGTKQVTSAPEFVSQETTPKPSAPTNIMSEISSNRAAAISNEAQTSITRTNGVAASPDNPAGGGFGALIFGLGLLVAAGILVVVMRQRSRDNSHSSLITRSIDGGRNDPPEN